MSPYLFRWLMVRLRFGSRAFFVFPSLISCGLSVMPDVNVAKRTKRKMWSIKMATILPRRRRIRRKKWVEKCAGFGKVGLALQYCAVPYWVGA